MLIQLRNTAVVVDSLLGLGELILLAHLLLFLLHLPLGDLGSFRPTSCLWRTLFAGEVLWCTARGVLVILQACCRCRRLRTHRYLLILNSLTNAL